MQNLDDDQNKQLMSWIQQNGSDNTIPRGTTVTSPTPSTVQAPVATDSGSEDENDTITENDSRIQDSHPGHSDAEMAKATPASDVASEASDKMAQASKYGPDQEAAVIQNILKSQGSLGNRFARGAAGLGDAIMGVAGKSSPGFLNSVENREQNRAKLLSESVPLEQKMNAEQMALRQAAEGQGANTPLNAAKRAVLLPTAQKLFPGKSQAEYEKMLQSPDDFSRMVGIPADVYKSEVEAKVKAQELTIQGKRADTEGKRVEAEMNNQALQRKQEDERIKANTTNQQAERAEQDRKLRVEHPILNKLGMIPGSGGQSSSSLKPGDVYKGHIFLGGDPANKNSWKRK